MADTRGTKSRHLFSVAFVALAVVAGCEGSGSNTTEFVTLHLSTDEDCYGVQVDVDALASGAECTPSAALLAEGCAADVEAGAGGLSLEASGCFVADGAELFDCTVSAALADDIVEAADVRCGCGCAEDCPMAPAVEVCEQGGDCRLSPGAARAAVANPSAAKRKQVSRSSQVTTTASSTTYCGTCCDVLVDSVVSLDSGDGVRELQFEVVQDGGDCEVSCDFVDGLDGPVSQKHSGEGVLRVCVADASGLDAPEQILSCESTGGGDPGDIRNVSALGADLRPLDPPPHVVSEED